LYDIFSIDSFDFSDKFSSLFKKKNGTTGYEYQSPTNYSDEFCFFSSSTMHSMANQYFSTKEKYLVMTSKGILGVWKPRPIDELYFNILAGDKSNSSSINNSIFIFDNDKLSRFIRSYGYTEVRNIF